MFFLKFVLLFNLNSFGGRDYFVLFRFFEDYGIYVLLKVISMKDKIINFGKVK